MCCSSPFPLSAETVAAFLLVLSYLGIYQPDEEQTENGEDEHIREIAREVASTLAAGPEGPRTRCSDETLTLPDLVGWDDGDNDR